MFIHQIIELIAFCEKIKELWRTTKDIQISSLIEFLNDDQKKFIPEENAEKDVYYGEYDTNQNRDGYGLIYYQNGDFYLGEWRKNQRQGRGIYVYHERGVYHGKWEGDEIGSYGCFCYPNGDVYIGGWKEGQKDGKGRYVYENGDVYKILSRE